MRFLVAFSFLLFITISGYTQVNLDKLGLQRKSIIYQEDSVHFLIKGTPEQLQKKKPVLLFLQGSMPVPLVIYDQQGIYSTFPFDHRPYIDQYHLVIISKPGIPIVADKGTLNELNNYLDPQTGRAPSYYNDRNHLDYYVGRTDEVLKYLAQQDYVDQQKLVVIGGSEGSTVGAKLATINTDITHLIYYSGNPMGRFESLIRDTRRKAHLGNLSQEEAQKEIDELYKKWASIVANPTDTNDEFGDTNYAWYSFSKPSLNYLLELDIPILVAYGTADVGAETNDYLPIAFAYAGKKNLSLMPFLNHNHGFFKQNYDENGKYIGSEYNFDAAFTKFMEWVDAH